MSVLKNPAPSYWWIAGLCLALLGFSTLPGKTALARIHPNFNEPPQAVQSEATGVWRRNGPEGGLATTLTFHPTNPNILFAGTRGGLMRSTNGGTSWSLASSGLEQFNIAVVLISPTNPNLMFVGTSLEGGGGPVLYKSVNGGESWTSAQAGLGFGQIGGLALHPQNPNLLFVIFNGMIFRTADGGENWLPANNGLENVSPFKLLACDPSDPQTAYLGTSTSGVYKTINGGASWFQTFLPFGDVYPTALAIDPVAPATVYAAFAYQGMFKSLNGGVTWNPIGPLNTFVSDIGILPSPNAGLLIATLDRGILRSTDNGGTWNALNQGLPHAYTTEIEVFRGNPHQLATVTYGDGVFISDNGGGTWQSANSGLCATYVQAVATDPANPNVVYAGLLTTGVGGSGLEKSTDGGRNWQRLNLSPSLSFFSLAVSPANPNLVLAGGAQEVARSENGGATWTLITNPQFSFLKTIVFAPSAPTVVYAASQSGSVFKRTNAGQTWAPFDTGLSQVILDGLAVDPTNPDRVFVSRNDGTIFLTTNGGVNWNQVATVPAQVSRNMVIDPTNPQIVYASFYFGGVFRSPNGGASWSNIFPTSQGFTLNPLNPTNLFNATGFGVFQSRDSGQTWSGLSGQGLAPVPVTEVVATGNASLLYLASLAGVFVLEEPTCPTVTRFFPLASSPGKTITITGDNFVPGTQVFFGGARLIPAAGVNVLNANFLQAVVLD